MKVLWRLCLIFAGSAAAAAPPSACAPCHRAQTARFADSGMAQALTPARDSTILRAHPKLTVTLGPYSYEIADSVLTVTDGKETVRVPLEWAFGKGAVGQTFLFQRDGRWYESRVSYYATLHALDLTIGASPATPPTLLDAAGRLAPPAEATLCFDCHATGVTRSTLAAMTPGVQCERCHGSAGRHLTAAVPMRKLGGLTTEEISELCGQCHRTWSQIASNGPRGIQNVRFQPYRLANSKCYDAEDRRIRCTACHDPHGPLETSAAAYDARCAACHAARACKVGVRDCVSCHMPKLELPGAHQKFTDHRIRIVRAGEAYPD
jgi:hypothetical protein